RDGGSGCITSPLARFLVALRQRLLQPAVLVLELVRVLLIALEVRPQIGIDRVATAEVGGAVAKSVDGGDPAVAIRERVPRLELDGSREVADRGIELQRLKPAESAQADRLGIIRLARDDGL